MVGTLGGEGVTRIWWIEARMLLRHPAVYKAAPTNNRTMAPMG